MSIQKHYKTVIASFFLIVAVCAVVFQNCSGINFYSQKNSIEQSATLPAANTPSSPATEVDSELTISKTVWMSGLESPWDMAFTSDNNMFFTEKCRGLSVRKTNGQVVRLFGAVGSSLVAADLFCQSQSGMNGVALDPNFTNNRLIYVFMSSNLSTNPRTNRVVKLTVANDFNSVSAREDIITDIPFKDVSNNWGGAGAHSGGRIRFGLDGYLYVTTGDNHNGTLPQSLQKLGGKVLRVDTNGQAAVGNNTPAGGDSRIFTYGHRNIQGIAFRGTQVFTAEHGPNHTDEVNLLVAGGNSGWDPFPEAGVTCTDNYCGYTSNKADGSLTPMTDKVKFPNAFSPIWINSGKSQGTGPLTFITGTQWKSWNGRLLVGIMGDRTLLLLTVNDSGGLISANKANIEAARYRSLVQAPDGNLYIAVDSGEIWKISPQ